MTIVYAKPLGSRRPKPTAATAIPRIVKAAKPTRRLGRRTSIDSPPDPNAEAKVRGFFLRMGIQMPEH